MPFVGLCGRVLLSNPGRPQMPIWNGTCSLLAGYLVTTDAHSEYVEASWNVMAHVQKADFVFRRNGRVHLNRRRRQFSRLLAAEVCASAVVMLDTPCSEVVWRVLATHSIRQFPLYFPSLRHRVPSRFSWSLPKLIEFRILRAFAYSWKASHSSVMSVRMHQLGSHWMDFRENWYERFSLKFIGKIIFLVKIGQKYGTLCWRPACVYCWRRLNNVRGKHSCVSMVTLSVPITWLTAKYVGQQCWENALLPRTLGELHSRSDTVVFARSTK